jgi:DNA-binding Xre family transcriptional regulator
MGEGATFVPETENIPHPERTLGQKEGVPSSLDKQLAQFLRRTRGEQTFADFSRKLGLPPSTLHRLETCEQSITLGRLHQIMTRLKCDLPDIFPGRSKSSRS